MNNEDPIPPEVEVKVFYVPDPSIRFFVSSDQEMLRIEPSGFYVRGVKVEADENEARKVYESFREFLHIALGRR